MNRWIRRSAAFASLVGSLALVAGGVAYAHDTQDPQAGQGRKGHHEGQRAGLIGAALKLDSITPEQRASIEQLVQQRRTARMPVRQADAQALTVLAQQVEQAHIDPQGLAPTLSAEQSAAEALSTVDRDTLNRLHSILSPDQRGQLVDRLEAGHAQREHTRGRTDGGARFGWGLNLTPEQRSQIRANLSATSPANGSSTAPRSNLLEAFRGDSFDASAFMSVRNPGTRMERLAQAMVPVLSPSQRATFANHLRTKAQHESSTKGA